MKVAEGGDAATLFDRARELAAIEEAIEAARAGSGRLLLIEGSAGVGKTRLIAEARCRAAAADVTTLHVRGAELECESPFGIVRQLFEPLLLGRSPNGRNDLLEGVAESAGPLFEPSRPLDDRPLTDDRLLATLHGVYWLTANLAKRGPHQLLIDDAHWADISSLRWLAYLAPRIGDLSLNVIAALRTAEQLDGERRRLLSILMADPSVELLQPANLTQSAVTALVEAEFTTDPDPAFCEVCRNVTAGNPFFLTHLLGALKRDSVEPTEAASASLPQVVPHTVVRTVVRHLATLPEPAARLARAAAVFEDCVELRHAAKLADLDMGAAHDATDLLVSADILKSQRPFCFVHPIVREAVYTDLSSRVRMQHHTAAARMLIADGAAPERAAAHLLRTEPDGRSWAVDVLREAGRRAMQRGSPDSGVTYLQRALSEPPEANERAGVLWELGSAKVLAREPDAATYLTKALEASDDPVERGKIADDLGRLLTLSGRADEAIDRLVGMLDEFQKTAPDVAVRLTMDLGIAAWVAEPPRPKLVEQLAERYWSTDGVETADASPLVANCAFAAFAAGAPADAAALHAEEALRTQGVLSGETADSPAFQFALSVLTLTDRFDLAGRLCDEALAEARRRGSVGGVAAISCWRSRNNLFRGAIAEAEADARLSLAVAQESGGWELGLPVSVAFLIDALIERGNLEAAQETLVQAGLENELPECLMCHPLLHTRGRLRILQGRNSEGLEDLFTCGSWQERWPIRAPGMAPWRTAAAPALVAQDEREARRLVAEELELARAFGAPRALGGALRAAGLVERGERGVELLREAVAVLEDSPARLERARALTDLGSLLRRAGKRREARDVLRAGLDTAHRGGMLALADRARDELVAAGARPRRAALSGVEALTPSELRVAKRAADGLSNPRIAQELFVTLRTVEMHLTNAYGKLEIRSRHELATALREGAELSLGGAGDLNGVPLDAHRV